MMLETITETFIDGLVDRVAQRLMKLILPRLEASMAVQPRWLNVESAGLYIDKTVPGMRHTLNEHSRELPFARFAGAPRIDREDIDRLGLNLKGR
jgi:hypothetical protein